MDPFFVLVHSIQTLHVNQLMIDLNFHKNQSVTTTFLVQNVKNPRITTHQN